jgi:hypothetical protein
MSTSLTQRLRADMPLVHEDGRTCAGLSWSALEWLESHVLSGMRTLETGAGLSTIVFAASGADHVVVTPEAAEEQALRAACEKLAVSVERVNFVIGRSEDVLPQLDTAPLDLALVDGAHGFPYAIVDWWELSRRLRVGGSMLLDDAYLPPVLAILDGLRGVPSWRIEGPISDRTVLVRKVAEGLPSGVWPGGPFGGRMSFRYLPPRRRLVAAVRHRLFATGVGRRLVSVRQARRSRS